MKKTLLSLVLLVNLLWGDNLCLFDDSEFESVIKKKHLNEMTDLKKGLYVQCAYLKEKTKGFIAYSYYKEVNTTEALYSISNIIALVDITNKKVIDSQFYKDEYLSKNKTNSFTINAVDYQKVSKNDTVGVLIKVENSRRREYLSLFEFDGIKVHRILKNFVHDEYHEEMMKEYLPEWVFKRSTLSSSFKVDKHDGSYKKINFSQGFDFEYEDKDEVLNSQWDKRWRVTLEDKEFIYKNGSYVAIESKPIFNLKQIALNTKKGLKYKRVVLEAMLLEAKISSENIESYEDIAVNLYKHKRYATAEMLFKKIIDYDANCIKSHFYLGEIYWDKAQEAKDGIDTDLKARDLYYYEMEVNTFEIKATQHQVAYMRNLLKPYKTEKNKIKFLLEKTSDKFRNKIKKHTHLLHNKALLSDVLYHDASVFKMLDPDMKDDKEIATISIEQAASNMKYLGNKFNKNSSFIYELIKEKNERIQYIDEFLKKDKAFIFAVCQLNRKNFSFAHKSLKKDKAYVSHLLNNSIYVFDFSDESIKNDRAFILDYVRDRGYVPSSANKKFFSDKEFALETTRSFGKGSTIDKQFYADAEVMWLQTNHDWIYTEYIAKSLKNDKVFMLALAQKDIYRTSKYLNDRLKTDMTVILASIKKSCYDFKDLNASIKNDKSFVLKAIKANGKVLQYLNKRFQDDKKLVLEAVKYTGYAGYTILDFASDRLKDDKEVVLSAIKKNANSLKFASDRLKKDKEVVLEAVANKGETLRYADKKFRKDREVLERAVSSDGYALEYADSSFKKDFTLYNLVPKKDKDRVYGYLDKSIKQSKEYLCLAMKYSYDIWEDYRKYLEDEELMLCAIEERSKSFKYTDKKLKSKRDFILKAVKVNGEILKYVDKKFRDDREIVEAAISSYGGAILWAHDRFEKDKELVLKAIKKDAVAFSFLSYDNPLNKDKEVVLLSVQKDGLRLKELRAALKKEKEIVLEAVKQNGLALKYAGIKFQKDKEIIMEALKQNPKAFRFVKKQDKEIVLTAVRGDGMQMRFAYYIYKKDKEIALEAMKQNAKAWKFISYLLVNDQDILVEKSK